MAGCGASWLHHWPACWWSHAPYVWVLQMLIKIVAVSDATGGVCANVAGSVDVYQDALHGESADTYALGRTVPSCKPMAVVVEQFTMVADSKRQSRLLVLCQRLALTSAGSDGDGQAVPSSAHALQSPVANQIDLLTTRPVLVLLLLLTVLCH